MSTVSGARNVGILLLATAALAWAGVAARGHTSDAKIASVAAVTQNPEQPSQAVDAGVRSEPVRHPEQAASGEMVMTEFGIRTAPPPDGAVSVVTKAQVRKLVGTREGPGGTPRVRPELDLRYVTNDFAKGHPAGLAWVATFRDTTGHMYGYHPPPPPAVPDSSVVLGCTTTVIVNAKTGNYVGREMQSCRASTLTGPTAARGSNSGVQQPVRSEATAMR